MCLHEKLSLRSAVIGTLPAWSSLERCKAGVYGTLCTGSGPRAPVKPSPGAEEEKMAMGYHILPGNIVITILAIGIK